MTYHLKVHAVTRCEDGGPDDTCYYDPDRLDFTVDFARMWVNKDKFLAEASDLLQFVPRQIVELPKLACQVGLVKYDKCAYFLNLPGSPYDHLSQFPRCFWRGAHEALRSIIGLWLRS